MNAINDLLTSSWFTAVGTIASIIGLLLTIISTLNYIQHRTVKSEHKTGEDSYLKGLIDYIHHLNIHSAFDEQFFVDREYKVKDKYQPRAFFIARHQSVSPQISKLFGPVMEQPKKPSDGYFTKNLFREATARNEPVIVLGDPGSGKSVSARQLATTIANRALKSARPNRLIPIFISLSEYTGNDLEGQPLDFYSFLSATLQNRGKGTGFPSKYLVDHLDYYLESGRLFFILDSLDEMPPASFSSRCESIMYFIMQYSINSFVITCRSNDFGGYIKGREAYLDKLKPREVRAFINKRRSLLRHWKPSELYKRLMNPAFVLSPVVDNPFYLNLIIFFLSIRGILPENFPMLFRAVCKDWAEREIKKELIRGGIKESANLLAGEQLESSSSELRLALSHIAFAISSSSGFGTYISRSEIERLSSRYGMSLDSIKRAIQLGVNGGILDINFEESKLRFVHHKFQEYFAAEFLNRALEQKLIEYQQLPSICHNIWWEEVTALLTSITDHPEEVIEVLLQDAMASSLDDNTPTVLQRNFWLIGRAIRLLPEDSASKSKLVEEVISITEKLSGSRLAVVIDRLRALGEIDDQRSVDILATYLKSPSKILREVAFSELSNISLGRQFLVQRVYQIGYYIYIKGEYGGYGGRHAKRVKTIAFPSAYARTILNLYAAVGAAIRLHKVLFTLGVASFAYSILLRNVYCVLSIVIKLFWDMLRVYVDRTTPSFASVSRALISRSIFLILLVVFALRGFFIPPFWSAVSLMAVWLIHLAIIFSIFSAPKIIRNAIKIFLLRMINPKSFEMSSEHAKLVGLRLGYIDPNTYIQENISSAKELNRLLNKLATKSDFEGVEIELFEAIQNAERRLLQKKMTPNILGENASRSNGNEEKNT